MQFLQQHQRTLRSRLGHACFDHRQVGGGITVVALLDQGDGGGLREFMRGVSAGKPAC
jgi:hypothetical protein